MQKSIKRLSYLSVLKNVILLIFFRINELKDQIESIKVELEEKVVQDNEPDEDDASKSKLYLFELFIRVDSILNKKLQMKSRGNGPKVS